MHSNELVKIVQEKIGYEFKNSNLLITALTHSSYSYENFNCENNEKLEFLGDAILNFVIAKRLFENGANEGEMTKKRSKIVSRTPLKDAVLRLGLLELVRFGKSTDDKTLSDKSISNVFEALLAAIYLDSGSMSCAEKFMITHLKEIEDEIDYKTEIQEIAQAKKQRVEYETNNVGDIRHPYFSSIILIDNVKCGEGQGKSKKEAEKNAAKVALSSLNKIN